VIASGWHIAALTLKMFVEAGGYGDTPVLGLGNDELRWNKVVCPGDRLTVKREVVELRRSRSNPANGLVRTRITVVNQSGETVLSMLATGMIGARSVG
jgi:acyl dehydratase